MVLCSIIDVFKKIADKCVQPIVGYVTTEVGYLINYKANIENLRPEVENLNDATKSLEDRIEDARNRSGATQVDAVAQRWLERMTALNEEASRIIRDEERETERCLMGLRPNLWACYLASKSAKKVMDDAEELKKDGAKIDTVAHIDYSQCLGVATNPDFAELESRKKVSDQIVEHLKDPDVKIVGMYGMGGAGKTTLAEKIGVQLYEDGTFKYVVLSVVSNQQKQDPVHNQKQMDGLIYVIQKRIADLLKIELQERECVEARAKQLHEQLVRKDKLLIILDDIWHRLELRDVGIPIDSNSPHELKVLITSRDVNVMNYMDSKHNVPLDILTTDDAWKLFNRMAGGVDQDSDHYPTALDVVKQCGGIPVLLVTIARALRNRGLETWKEALTQLERFDGDDFVEDAYKRIEVSYQFLKNDEIRSLFLLCSQMDPHSIPIEDLLRYTIGLGLFKGRKKLKEVSYRLRKYLSDLIGFCLLQDGNANGTVRMHDVVYKFATFVASRDNHTFIVSDEFEEWPSTEQLEQLTAISLPYCRLPPRDDHQLTAVLFDTPKLESFLKLRREDEWEYLEIPDNFFIGMTGLKLLDLRKMSLSPVLPTSLSILVKLQTLCLGYCKLDDIAMIGELLELQVLSLKSSNVGHLPTEIGNLARLKVLDLSECHHLEVIARGVLSKLTLLEDLRIENNNNNNVWEQEGCSSNGTETASLEELRKLQNLSNLQINIDDGKMYPRDLIFVNLETFRIGIKCPVPYEFSSSKSLGLDLDNARVDQLDQGIKALIKRAENLSLENIEGFTSLCELINLEYFPHLKLKHLKVAGIAEIPYIAQQSYERTTPAFLLNKKIMFPRLEELKLSWMRADKIWEGQLAIESFQSLTRLEVTHCHKLSYLFSSLMVENLGQLKVLLVEYCNSVEEIVAGGGEEMTEEKILVFPKLEELTLYGLEKLKKFCHANLLKCPSLKKLMVRDCKELLTFITNDTNHTGDLETINSSILFDKKVVFPNLEGLRLENLDQLKMIWGNELHPDSLSKLKSLLIWNCASLESVFPAYLSLALQQFEKLQLENCERMRGIVAWKEAEAIDCSSGFVFSKLNSLILEDLPRLEKFYFGYDIHISDWSRNLPCLKEFFLHNCPKTDMQQDGTFAEIIPILDYYSFERDDLCVKYQNSDGGLYIEYPELFGGGSQVFPVALLQGFQHLKKLVVTDSNLEQVLFRSDLQLINPGDDEDTVAKILQRIQNLELVDLPKMTYIWSEHSSSNQILHNLESLHVESCGSLISLAPSTALFQNLRHLDVLMCGQLKKLLTSSIARSLINLIEMTVRECRSLTEIVGDIIDEDEDAIEDNDIVFGKLKDLKLVALTSLTSFCSAHNCSFKFPSLNSVTVQRCPNMVFFSPGILTAPKLTRVMEGEYGEELWRWEGDLNSTIRQWHKELMV